MPVFDAAAIPAKFSLGPADTYSQVHISIVFPPADTLKDTTVAFAPPGDSITLVMTVRAEPGDLLTGDLDYLRADGSLYAHGQINVIAGSAFGGGASTHVDTVIMTPGDTTSTPTIASIVTVSGGNQSGVVGTVLPQPFIVLVQDQHGLALPGQSVSFDPSAAGSVNPSSAVTDAQGHAQTSMTLGNTPATYGFNAKASSFTASVNETATAGPVASVTVVSGNGQSGIVTTQLPIPLTVKVADKLGNAKSGVTVTWAPAGGTGSGGFLIPASSVTAADGTASTTLGFALTAGTVFVTASAGGITSTPFTETGLVGPAAAMTTPLGTTIIGQVNVPINNQPYLLITDVGADPIANVSVTATLFSGANVLAVQLLNSDATGKVTFTGVIPPVAGNYTIQVVKAGLANSPITFTVIISPAG